MRIAFRFLALLCVLASICVVSRGESEGTIGDSGDDLLAGLSSENKKVKVLTSETFEHDTQASSGMTTGDWFVMFYADFCGACRHMKPIWEELATQYDVHQTSIAKVDAEEASDLRRRFNIRSFPTLILFRNKKMYRYVDHSRRDVKSLVKFLTEPLYNVEAEDIHPPFTYLDEFLFIFNSIELNDFIQLYDESPAMFMVLSGMTLISFILLLVSCFFPAIKAAAAKPPKPKAPKTSGDRKTK